MGKFLSGLSDHGQFLSGSPGSYFYHLTPGWLLFICSPHLIESPTGATESLDPTHFFSGQRNLHRPAGPSLTYYLFKNFLQIYSEQWNHFPESINYLLFPSDNPLKPTTVHCGFGQLKKKNVKKISLHWRIVQTTISKIFSWDTPCCILPKYDSFYLQFEFLHPTKWMYATNPNESTRLNCITRCTL